MKKILLSSLLLLGLCAHAEEVTGVLGIETGFISYSTDKSSATIESKSIRVYTGLTQQMNWIEGRFKIFLDFGQETQALTSTPEDKYSMEAGLSYELLFGSGKLKPLLGIEWMSSIFNHGDYSASGGYGGFAARFAPAMEVQLRAGYKQRDYNGQDLVLDGVDYRINFTYIF